MPTRKALSVFLSAVLVFTMCPAFASAEEIQPQNSVISEGNNPEEISSEESVTTVYVDSEVALKKGDSMKLNISTEPEGQEYSCTSSDESVVEVTNSGMLYAVGMGEADVIVMSGEGSAVCHVTVVDFVAPESISFTKSVVTLIQGKTFNASVRVNPEDANIDDLSFKSSNTAVAQVNSEGVVTAVKAGTATITATVGDKSAQCAVTVTLPKPIGVTANGSGLGSVTVKWNKVKNATGYFVYRSTAKNGTYKLVKTVTSGNTLSFKNTGLVKGKNYFYKVKARSGNTKCHSAFSLIVSAKATFAAPSMKNTANATKNSVKVSWTKVVGAKGYYVYRKKGSGAWTRIKTVTGVNVLTYNDKKASGVCQYAVAAYGKANGKVIVGARSAAVGTRTLAAPGSIDASYSVDFVRTIRWGAVTGATGYQIYYKAGDNGSWKLGATLGKKTSYTMKVNHGVYYYFKVRPIYKSGAVTTYGPFKQTAYGWIHYYNPNYSVITLPDTDPDTEIMAIDVTNHGNCTMRFYSEGARYTDGEGYTSYNRNLSLINQNTLARVSYIDIKPGTSKTLFFRVKPNGNSTWYDRYGTIRVKFRYDGMYYWSYNSYYYGCSYDDI